MISLRGVSKTFETSEVLHDINLDIPTGSVYGLLGSNGSGKSTILRLIAGIYKPTKGKVLLDNAADTYENTSFKNELFFVADEPYFFAQSSINEMARFYKQFYSRWNEQTYAELCAVFPLNLNARISTFSKGMKRQALIILGFSASPKYLMLDEAFDGLDPVMRTKLKKVITNKVIDENMTVISTTHNINEFENLCDTIAVIHQGKKLFERQMEHITDVIKVQVAFSVPPHPDLFADMQLLNFESRGSLAVVTIRGTEEEVLQKLQAKNPVFLDVIPLTLEEVFLLEMGGVGYGYNHGA